MFIDKRDELSKLYESLDNNRDNCIKISSEIYRILKEIRDIE